MVEYIKLHKWTDEREELNFYGDTSQQSVIKYIPATIF